MSEGTDPLAHRRALRWLTAAGLLAASALGAPGARAQSGDEVADLRRELRVTDTSDRSTSAAAWGVSLSGLLGVGKSDKLAVGANLGDGGGRYLLGLPAGSAGFVDVVDGKIELQRVAGAFATYRHEWTPEMRSTAAFGRAWVGVQIF